MTIQGSEPWEAREIYFCIIQSNRLFQGLLSSHFNSYEHNAFIHNSFFYSIFFRRGCRCVPEPRSSQQSPQRVVGSRSDMLRPMVEPGWRSILSSMVFCFSSKGLRAMDRALSNDNNPPVTARKERRPAFWRLERKKLVNVCLIRRAFIGLQWSVCTGRRDCAWSSHLNCA